MFSSIWNSLFRADILIERSYISCRSSKPPTVSGQLLKVFSVRCCSKDDSKMNHALNAKLDQYGVTLHKSDSLKDFIGIPWCR